MALTGRFSSSIANPTPLSLYLWGRLRKTVCLAPPVDLQELCQGIHDAYRGITLNELNRVHRNIVREMQLCIGVGSEPFEQLLYNINILKASLKSIYISL